MTRLGIRRWHDLIPEIVLVGGLTFFLIDETDAATSAFESVRAVLIMLAIAVGWVVGRLVLTRFVPTMLARTSLMSLGALGVLALIVLPAYDDETVVEAFPRADQSARAATPTVVEDSIETSTTDRPTVVRTGAIRGIDHRAKGTVRVYRQPDGTFVVGLEEIDIQPGPDYDLYLVPGSDRQSTDGGLLLDDLAGNKGTQYYEVPSGSDLERGEWTVLVWCVTFDVPIANATPQAV